MLIALGTEAAMQGYRVRHRPASTRARTEEPVEAG